MKNDVLRKLKSIDNSGNQAREFLDFDIVSLQKLLSEKDEDFWNKAGERKALRLFKAMSKKVPAYKDFLKKKGVDSKKIKTIEDFSSLPILSKKNYIEKYPLQKRCWDGKLENSDLVAVSSGTTGAPAFWPRNNHQEFLSAIMHDLIYRDIFKIDKKKTLLLIGFPMGIYVSGVATLLSSWLVGSRMKNLTIVPVGNNKSDMLRVFKKMNSSFDQVLLVGHPFFIKDIIESGIENKIKWSTRKLKIMLCSEGFTEEWRDYLLSKMGHTNRASQDIISTYGSSEFLLMGFESSFTIAFRKKLTANKELLKEFFPNQASCHGIFHYNPLLQYIEAPGKNLLFTVTSGLPLTRFDLKDEGSIISIKKARKAFPSNKSWNLPLVALRGRGDQAIVFYAANIYPEHIHGLLNSKTFLNKLTGKFTMRKGYLKNQDAYLEINIELKQGGKISAALANKIQKDLIKHLKIQNLEYLFLWNNLDKDIRPKIKLWPYQSSKFFKPGLKPRYIQD